jgi:hypothetical protein
MKVCTIFIPILRTIYFKLIKLLYKNVVFIFRLYVYPRIFISEGFGVISEILNLSKKSLWRYFILFYINPSSCLYNDYVVDWGLRWHSG